MARVPATQMRLTRPSTSVERTPVGGRLDPLLPSRKCPRSRVPPIPPPLELRIRDSRPALPEGSPDSPPSRRHASGPSRAFGVMDPIRNRTVKRPRRSGRGVAPPGLGLDGGDPGPRWVPAGFLSSSGRRARVGDRNLGSVARILLGAGTGRNPSGTEWGLNRNRDPSGPSRMVSDWGPSGDSDPSRSSRQPKT